MLDDKDIILKRYALGMPGSEIARQNGVSKSRVNDFLRANENFALPDFQDVADRMIRKNMTLDDFLPRGVTNKRELKVPFELIETRSGIGRSTIICLGTS